LNLKAIELYTNAIESLDSSRNPDNDNLLFEILLERERLYGLEGRRKEQAEDLRELSRLATGDDSRSIKVLVREASYHYALGSYPVSLERAQAAEELSERNKMPVDEAVSIKLLVAKAMQALGDLDEVLLKLRSTLAIASQSGNKSLEASVQSSFGDFYQSRGDFKLALKYIDEARKLYREASDYKSLERLSGQMGIVYKYMGQFELASKSFQESLEAARRAGDKKKETTTLGNLAIVSKNMGLYDEALSYIEQALQTAREIRDRHSESTLLDTLGNIERALGRYEKAIEHLTMSINLSEETGERPLVAKHYSNLASVYSELGEYEKAIELEEHSIEISKEVGGLKSEALSMIKLGTLYDIEGDHDKAGELLERAIEIFEETDARTLYIDALLDMAEHYIPTGDLKKASDFIEKARNHALKHKLEGFDAEVSRLKSEIELGEGNLKEALSIIDEAVRDRGVGGKLSFLHFRILERMGETAKAREIIDELYGEVYSRAEGILGPAAREGFLENVAFNREVIAAWRRFH
jgi:tetratricopeptide (TPR) repeat protein